MLPEFQVNLPAYQGPLGGLVDQLRQQRLSIQDVPLALVALQLLEYVETTARHLDQNFEWLEIAARLIHWKSRALLHPDPELQQQHDSELFRDLGELLQAAQKAADLLAERERELQAGFSRSVLPESPAGEQFVSLFDLLQQIRDLRQQAAAAKHARREPPYELPREEVTVGAMAVWLQRQLAAEEPLDGTRLLAQQPSLARRSCLFLAVLELVRDQQIQLEQQEAFAPMLLWSRPAPAEIGMAR